MTYKSSVKSTMLKSLLAASLLLPVFPFATPAAAAQGLSVWLDGKAITYNQAPVIVNGATFVPLRETLEALGMKVEWDATDGTMTLSKGALTIPYDPIQKFPGVQDPMIQDGHYMIHIRAFDYLIGADLQWDAKQNTVRISTQNTQLMEALKSKNVPAVQTALQNGADPNATVYDIPFDMEETFLSYAADTYDLAMVKVLLEAGADPNKGEHTPLEGAALIGRTNLIKLLLAYDAVPSEKHLGTGMEGSKFLLSPHKFPDSVLQDKLRGAVRAQNAEKVRFLLEELGVKVDSADDGEILYNAIFTNNPIILDLLIAHGANVNLKTETGMTPLIMAAYLGNATAAKKLLAAHADPNLHKDGEITAWMVAHMLGNSETEQVLLDAGAQTSELTPTDDEKLRAFFGFKEDRSFSELPPLLQAALQANTGEVKRLLAEGTQDLNNLKPEELAYVFYFGHTETIKALLADPKRFDQRTKSQLLDTTMFSGNLEIIHTLLESGIESNEDNHYLLNSLAYALNNNNSLLLEDLLKHGAKQMNQTELSLPAMHEAASRGNTDALRTLLAHMDGMSDEEKNESIASALEVAVFMGNMECFDLLMKANPNAQSKNRALYTAVDISDTDAIKVLLAAGADPDFIGNKGLSTRQLAKQKGNPDILTLL